MKDKLNFLMRKHKEMSRMDKSVLYAAIISGALLFGAIVVFEFMMGLEPCLLCEMQRIPHMLILVLALTYFFLPPLRRFIPIDIAILAAMGIGLGVLHVGVEQGWWEFASSCTASAPLSSADVSAMFRGEGMEDKIVRCDEIAWSLMGVSMAGWQAIVSGFILGIAIWGMRK